MSLHFNKIGDGKPVIILHGVFGSGDNWVSFPKLFPSGYCFYLVDQRNHGRSFHASEMNYNVMSEDLKQLIEDEGLDKILLIGHSMGGKAAMRFTLDNSELVTKLVVVDIAPRAYPVHHQWIIDALKSIPLDTIQARKEAEELLSESINDWGIRQFLLKNLSREDGQFKLKLNLHALEHNIEAIGAEIKGSPTNVPTLFIGGSKSDYIKKEDEQQIRALFTDSTIEVVSGAGHWVHAEKPEELAQLIQAFFAS